MATLEGRSPVAPQAPSTGRRGINPGDKVFQSLMVALSLLTLAILVLLALTVFRDSLPVWAKFGLPFTWSTAWNPVEDLFGAGLFLYGTIVTAIIALLLATPIGLGAAVFLVEYAPARYANPISFMVELLAAIPSVIFGLWGLYVMAPVMRGVIEPTLQNTVGQIPIIGALFGGTIIGRDYLTAGTILAVMILPTIMAVSREVIRSVPDTQREGMLGLGATRYEVIQKAVLPYARSGIVGAVILGLARAIGETMAVTMTIGNSARAISPSLFTPGYTLASGIANQFNEAGTNLYFGALMGLAIILLALALLTNIVARVLVTRVAGSVGTNV